MNVLFHVASNVSISVSHTRAHTHTLHHLDVGRTNTTQYGNKRIHVATEKTLAAHRTIHYQTSITRVEKSVSIILINSQKTEAN